MITAVEAQEMAKHSYNIEYSIDREILVAACRGKREFIYDDILPSYIKEAYKANGYTITEQGCQTRIKW